MNAQRALILGVVASVVGLSSAQAGPLVGGRLGVTIGGGGEFDAGRGFDADHQDMGGTSYDGFVLIPIADVIRVGTVFQLTPHRSVRVEQSDNSSAPDDMGTEGGRWDFGKTAAMNAIFEYDIFVAPKNEYSLHMAAGGGLLICMPKYEVEHLLEERSNDGVKMGYNFGLGIGGTRLMESKVGLRADFSVKYENMSLVRTPEFKMGFNTLRYILSLGLILAV